MAEMTALFVCAGLSLNLVLQFALGIQHIADDKKRCLPVPLFQGAVLFLSITILWFVSNYVLAIFAFGFLEYFLLFPLTALACTGFESLAARFFPAFAPAEKHFSALSAYNGLAFTALWMTLHLAGGPLEALLLSLSFSAGVIFTLILLKYIYKRSLLEAVPMPLRGHPLMLISMGLLSLVFTSLTAVFFRILGVF